MRGHDVHDYAVTIDWTGDRGTGTSGYRDYDRHHTVSAAGKPTIAGSADPVFRGAPDRWTPEDLLVAALAQCHLLWYLHLAADAGVLVTGYHDQASGSLLIEPDGGGRFTEVVLRPRVTVRRPEHAGRAQALHVEANRLCFIARSVSFPVRHEPITLVEPGTAGAG